MVHAQLDRGREAAEENIERRSGGNEIPSSGGESREIIIGGARKKFVPISRHSAAGGLIIEWKEDGNRFHDASSIRVLEPLRVDPDPPVDVPLWTLVSRSTDRQIAPRCQSEVSNVPSVSNLDRANKRFIIIARRMFARSLGAKEIG